MPGVDAAWVVITVLLAIGLFYASRWNIPTPREPLPADRCVCGHDRDWHEHHHDRTYCAATSCECPRFKEG